MGDKPRAELFAALAQLYRTRDYSDLVIFAKDGSRHPVHRCIICPRSPYFANVIKEGKWRERNEGHIALDEEEPEIVRLLIEYLYLLDYDPLAAATEDSSSSSHGDYSDTMSVRTEAGQYGHVYGTSAVSAFGGPVSATLHSSSMPLHHHHGHHPSPPLSTLFRPRTDSSLTVHALPTGGAAATDFAVAADFRAGNPGGSSSSNMAAGRAPAASAARRRATTARGVMVTTAPDPSPLAAAEPHLILHSRLYAAAARYGIEGLRALALDKFKIQLTRHWDSSEFPEAIHIVYHSTPAGDKDMREAVADTLEWHSRLLDKPEIEISIMDINGLAYDLLKRSRRAEPEYME